MKLTDESSICDQIAIAKTLIGTTIIMGNDVFTVVGLAKSTYSNEIHILVITDIELYLSSNRGYNFTNIKREERTSLFSLAYVLETSRVLSATEIFEHLTIKRYKEEFNEERRGN